VHVFNALKIETSKSSEISLFKRFQKHWDHISYAKGESLAKTDSPVYNDEAKQLLSSWKSNALNTIQTSISYSREDYKELSQLCQAVLNNNDPGRLRQGGMHKARWMSKIIYSIKICLLKEQISALSRGTLTTQHQEEKLKEFVVYIYCDWWLRCQSATDAPWLDLCLYKALVKYKAVSSIESVSAVKACGI